MKDHTPAAAPPPRPVRPVRISELQPLPDDRDETIRLLNEALSLALAELDRREMAA